MLTRCSLHINFIKIEIGKNDKYDKKLFTIIKRNYYKQQNFKIISIKIWEFIVVTINIIV